MYLIKSYTQLKKKNVVLEIRVTMKVVNLEIIVENKHDNKSFFLFQFNNFTKYDSYLMNLDII